MVDEMARMLVPVVDSHRHNDRSDPWRDWNLVLKNMCHLVDSGSGVTIHLYFSMMDGW